MLIFITAVSVVLVISFLCSIFESVLLSLTRPQIEVLKQRGESAGQLLSSFKENMDVPIAAILILNTAAHTIGAAVAGASYQDVFDTGTLWLFSIIFTIAVLFLTEIIPKTLGVTYAPVLATPVAHGIRWLTTVLRARWVTHPIPDSPTRAKSGTATRTNEDGPPAAPQPRSWAAPAERLPSNISSTSVNSMEAR